MWSKFAGASPFDGAPFSRAFKARASTKIFAFRLYEIQTAESGSSAVRQP
jgi:hypothetical protein